MKFKTIINEFFSQDRSYALSRVMIIREGNKHCC
jgi:hypothetical protein